MAFTGDGRVAGSAGDPRPDDVVLAVDGALWATGGAAGVGDGRRCVGIDVHSGLGVSGGEQVGPGALAGIRIDGQRVVVSEVAGTVRGGQGQRRPGILDHPAGLRGCQVGVDPDPDGAESLSGEEGFDEGPQWWPRPVGEMPDSWSFDPASEDPVEEPKKDKDGEKKKEPEKKVDEREAWADAVDESLALQLTDDGEEDYEFSGGRFRGPQDQLAEGQEAYLDILQTGEFEDYLPGDDDKKDDKWKRYDDHVLHKTLENLVQHYSSGTMQWRK